ncbi:Molybdopterin synthase sulfur carrier subunit like protein [Verticillium longisporum]|nr:Molybdopterin synthase sulfur carrier subunit like protein [Verticillium longisporum]
MALNRKYANLPDLDSAPDIYETPDLTDDISTAPTTTGPSQSDDESRFLPSNVDASAADFSDRRILEDGTTEIGDLSDEDDEEHLDRKIARLQREIAEAKEEFGRKKAAAATQPAIAASDAQEQKLASLSQVIDEISRSIESHAGVAPSQKPLPPPPQPQAGTEAQPEGLPATGTVSYTITYAPTYEQSHALAKAADFDRRLVLLEKGIGIGSAALPEADTNGLPRAILPTLDALQRQIVTLSQASTSNLDAITRRVRTLTQEAHQLEKARQGAKAARESLGGGSPSSAEDAEDSEQTAKINALYGTLPTIESLAPLLPPLLDRLRSLRAVHADAASASEILERIEKQQADMTADMKQWREGLDKVEEAVREGGATMSGNMKVIEGALARLCLTPTGYQHKYHDHELHSSYTAKDQEALPAPLPLGRLFDTLEERYSGIKSKILDSCLVTINLDYVDLPKPGEDGAMIKEGDEVAIIPPVSSG